METIIALLILIVLLAFMADTLKVQFSRKEGELIPTINIDFKKDNRFYDFLSNLFSLQRGNTPTIINEDLGYITKTLFGEVEVNYGEESKTRMSYEMIISATVDSLDRFYYLNSDSDTEIRRLEGFKEVDTKFKKLREFSSWRVADKQGELSNLHTIILPIQKINKGQELKIRFDLNLFGYYKEIVDGVDLVMHGIFFRFLTKTLNASLRYRIPSGTVSRIARLSIHKQNSNNVIWEKDILILDNQVINLGGNYGVVSVEKNEKDFEVTWTIPTEIQQGTICRLRWYTEAN